MLSYTNSAISILSLRVLHMLFRDLALLYSNCVYHVALSCIDATTPQIPICNHNSLTALGCDYIHWQYHNYCRLRCHLLHRIHWQSSDYPVLVILKLRIYFYLWLSLYTFIKPTISHICHRTLMLLYTLDIPTLLNILGLVPICCSKWDITTPFRSFTNSNATAIHGYCFIHWYELQLGVF